MHKSVILQKTSCPSGSYVSVTTSPVADYFVISTYVSNPHMRNNKEVHNAMMTDK